MKLITDPIPGLILKIAVPASIGMFFQTMYNVVDTYYAGQLSGDALAALSMSFPPFLMVLSLGIGLGQGANALISNALGAGKDKQASLYQVQAISLAVLSTLIFCAVGRYYSEDLFLLMGAEGESLQLVIQYMNAIWMGGVVMVMVQVCNAGLLAQGDTKTNRNALIAGFVVNIFLDPLLMYGWGPIPAFGLAGIAWATIALQAMVVVYICWKLIRSRLMASFRWSEWMPHKALLAEIAYQGFPSSLNMVMVSGGIFIITSFVGRFGTEAIAAYGSAMRIEQIVLMPTIGLNISALSLTGQNFGAGFLQRVQEVYARTIGYSMALMIPGGMLVYLISPVMMSIFTDQADIIAIGVQYLRIDAFALPGYALLFLSLAVLQGLKRPVFGMIITLIRQVLAPLLVFTLLIGVWGLGLISLWWGIFGIVWMAALVALLYTRRALRRSPGHSQTSPV